MITILIRRKSLLNFSPTLTCYSDSIVNSLWGAYQLTIYANGNLQFTFLEGFFFLCVFILFTQIIVCGCYNGYCEQVDGVFQCNCYGEYVDTQCWTFFDEPSDCQPYVGYGICSNYVTGYSPPSFCILLH